MDGFDISSLAVADPAAPDATPTAIPVAGRPYGVLGRVLGHSYTPTIYRELAGLDYRRFEREPDALGAFLSSDEWEGVNVTIPYKQAVLPYLDELTPLAARMGNVNTITRLADGRLRGDNTDYFGFKVLAESLGLELAGKRALVMGHGGAGSTVAMVLGDLGMDVVFAGRAHRADDPLALTYDELGAKASDVSLAVNCTPVGMFPRCPEAPCDIAELPALEGVIDIVYNPARTAILLQAERRGIPHVGGLLMLVAQAAQAVERYTGATVAMDRISQVTDELSLSEQNVVIIGMPGSGKTRVGEKLASLLGREFIDIDHAFADMVGTPCAGFIEEHGEDAFRARETEVLSKVAARSGLVVSCGGGVVERAANYDLLHQNGRICMIDRPLGELAHKGRPITARDGVEALAERRLPLYRAWADITVHSTDSAQHTAEALAALL